MGKLESSPAHAQSSPHHLPWHAHLTALTVAPASRRLGLASLLTRNLERAGDANDAWFNDLFVRESNKVAQGMYKRMGSVACCPRLTRIMLTTIRTTSRYSVFRRVVGYYHDSDGVTDGEDGFDMRKPLKRDEKLEHIRANGEDHRVQPHDVW